MSKAKNIALGWFKYITGDNAEQWMIDRLNTCISNKGKCYDNTLYPMCKKCACHVKAKVTIKEEKCPMNKWKE